jgi:outer membrane protein TolC
MLKIEALARGHYRLTGALTAESLPALAEVLAAAEAEPIVLELGGIQRADREAVAFLAAQAEGRVRLERTPLCLRRWLQSERRVRSRGGHALSVAAAALLLAIPSSAAADPVRVSLREAIDRALREGTTAQLADEQIASSRFAADRARSPLLPQVDAQLLRGNESLNLDVLGFHMPDPIVPPFDIVSGQLTARWALVDLAAIRRYRAARVQVAVSEAERARLRSEAAAAVARLYVGLLKAEAQVHQSEATTALFERLLALARRQREAGVAGRLDTVRAEVQLNQQQRALLTARQRRGEASRALLEAMGAEVGAEVVATEDLPAEGAAASLPDVALALQAARERRAELRSLREQRRAAEMTVRAVAAERLPALQAQLHAEESGNTIGDLRYTRGVSVAVAVPVFTGGRIGAELGEARSRQHAVEIREQAAERLVERQVRDALLAVEAARERLGSAAAAARLTAEALESAQNRFGAGIAASIEVDNAQTAYVSAREDLVSAQADLAQARVDLDFATGDLVREAPPKP